MNWVLAIRWAIGLAAAAATLPLFSDLALCLAGNLLAGRRRRAAEAPPLRMAVVVPAHNEEQMVAATVASLRAASGRRPIYVVAHNCADRTAERARQAGAQVAELNNPGLLGKGAALRHGFAEAFAAGAEAVLVVDADSTVTANLVEESEQLLAQGAAIVQCRYELVMTAGRHPMLQRLKALAFRGMNVLRPRGRAALGFSTGLFGNGFALTRAALELVPFAVDGITEDAEYHARAVAQGLHVAWLEHATVLSGQPAAGEARAAQEARWEGGRMQAGRTSTGLLLKAFAHGRWRALETFLDLNSAPLARALLMLALAALAPSVAVRAYVLVCLALTALYVLGSALLGPEPQKDLLALAAAPMYLAWKAAITPLVLSQARRRAAWVRTPRERNG